MLREGDRGLWAPAYPSVLIVYKILAFSQFFSFDGITKSCFLFYQNKNQVVATEDSKQGRIHGNPVTVSWAGAEMRKSLGKKNVTGGRMDIPTYRPTR